MARIESSVHVPRSMEQVFAFLTKCESHLSFIPRMLELHQVSTGAFEQAGTKLSGTLSYLGIRIPVRYEIIGAQPNQELTMQGQMGPIHFNDGYVLSAAETGSRIAFWLELYPTGWTKFFSPFMGWIGKIHAYETLRNLKRELARREIAS